MIDFQKYIGFPVVLVTNFTKDSNRISGIRDERLNLHKFKRQFVIARELTSKDLKDEDFVDYLNKMWPEEKSLRSFLKYSKQINQ